MSDSGSGVGHNSGELQMADADPNVAGVAADRLRSIIERVERLTDEKKAINDDIKDIFSEAKSAGFDTTVVRRLLALRRRDPNDVEQEEMLLDTYRRALGM